MATRRRLEWRSSTHQSAASWLFYGTTSQPTFRTCALQDEAARGELLGEGGAIRARRARQAQQRLGQELPGRLLAVVGGQEGSSCSRLSCQHGGRARVQGDMQGWSAYPAHHLQAGPEPLAP